MGAKSQAETNEVIGGGVVTTTRRLVTVNGKELNNEASDGELTFINFKKLAEAGTTGTVATGIYEGSILNQYEKLDYKLRQANGDLVIVNAAGSLASQMAKIPTGTYVEVVYEGQSTMESGKFKGKAVHKIIVLREAAAE